MFYPQFTPPSDVHTRNRVELKLRIVRESIPAAELNVMLSKLKESDKRGYEHGENSNSSVEHLRKVCFCSIIFYWRHTKWINLTSFTRKWIDILKKLSFEILTQIFEKNHYFAEVSFVIDCKMVSGIWNKNDLYSLATYYCDNICIDFFYFRPNCLLFFLITILKCLLLCYW